MYPDPTTFAQMHLDDLRREAAQARRTAEHLRAVREAETGTGKSAPSLLTRIRTPRLWAPARLRHV